MKKFIIMTLGVGIMLAFDSCANQRSAQIDREAPRMAATRNHDLNRDYELQRNGQRVVFPFAY
jgi:hypothetical protein